MTDPRQSLTILYAEDDEDDRLLVAEALAESQLPNDLRFVTDGEELLDYLQGRGKYAAPGAAPRPGLVLLDLNMPRKDGREALRAIRADPSLSRIPIVVLTTSKAEEDVARTYDLGATSYIVKPLGFERMVEVVRALGHYWFDIVEPPPPPAGRRKS